MMLRLHYMFADSITIMECEFEMFRHLSVYSGSEGRTRGCPTCECLLNLSLLNMPAILAKKGTV